jgi:hypothetical protein
MSSTTTPSSSRSPDIYVKDTSSYEPLEWDRDPIKFPQVSAQDALIIDNGESAGDGGSKAYSPSEVGC